MGSAYNCRTGRLVGTFDKQFGIHVIAEALAHDDEFRVDDADTFECARADRMFV